MNCHHSLPNYYFLGFFFQKVKILATLLPLDITSKLINSHKQTWNARVLHETTAMLRNKSEIDWKCRFVVDDTANSMNAVSVERLRLVGVGVVLREQLRTVMMIDFVEFSLCRKRYEDNL